MRDELNFHVKRIAEFMGCPFSKEEEASGIVNAIVKSCSFDKMSNLEVNKSGKDWSGLYYNTLFRRAVTEDWKNYLTPDMAHQIDHLTIEKFKGSGSKLFSIPALSVWFVFEMNYCCVLF
ncbi:hypothetical protein ACH5RR_041160 [Cinchona calisaya]|uniref:Sulfotransferase n=1 Tax=Cinchona calisaya TaxID=153742 RepID=A0ABD2XU66_9GENT